MKVELLIIKEEDAICESIESLNNLIVMHKDIKIEGGKIVFKKLEFNFKIQTDKIESNQSIERSFHLTIERKIDIHQIKEIEIFSNLKKIIVSIIKKSEFGFRVNTIWDDISSHFTTQAYPVINEIENLMRKLIFKFMTMNVGMNWLETTTPKDIKAEIDNRIVKRGLKETLENSLYEADFIHLSGFLFRPYATITNENLVKYISKARKSEDIKLKDLKEFVPKSNWDRYFSNLISFEGLNKKWEELYSFRNQVAHNKHLSQKEFERILELSKEVNTKLTEAISKLDTIKVSEDDKKELSDYAVKELSEHAFYNYLKLKNRTHKFNTTSRHNRFGLKQLFGRDPNFLAKYHSIDFLGMQICNNCGKMISPVEAGDFVGENCSECHSLLDLTKVIERECVLCSDKFYPNRYDQNICDKCLLSPINPEEQLN